MSFSHTVRSTVLALAKAEVAAYGFVVLLAILLSKAG
jgi:hypothetical protein